MFTFSSYTDVLEIKCPGATESVMLVDNARLRRVNWLLNSFYNPQLGLQDRTCQLPVGVPAGTFQNTQPTPAGTYGLPPSRITKDDMQAAMWYLTGEHGSSRQWKGCPQRLKLGLRAVLMTAARHLYPGSSATQPSQGCVVCCCDRPDKVCAHHVCVLLDPLCRQRTRHWWQQQQGQLPHLEHTQQPKHSRRLQATLQRHRGSHCSALWGRVQHTCCSGHSCQCAAP